MISLDRRNQQGDHPLENCSRSLAYRPHGTLLPRHILLAEADCERLSARGHILERYGYEVLSCGSSQSIERSLGWMSRFVNIREFVDLIICDVDLLNDAIVSLIHRGQQEPHFPPLLLITTSVDTQTLQQAQQIKHNGSLHNATDPHEQIVLVRRWAPY